MTDEVNSLDYVVSQLKAPFPESRLKWRKSGGGDVVYVDARDYMNRLDEVCMWQDEYEVLDAGTVICRLGIKIGGEWIWRSDGAGQTNIEGEKGGFTDAFKRACVKFGLGRYLYYLSASSDHKLPSWATPEGYAKIQEERKEK